MLYLTFADIWWQFLLFIIGSYLVGNINFAVIISLIKKNDIRKLGSGNPGTLNMSRNFGLGIGVLTLVLDIVKGALPTLVAMLVYNNFYFLDTQLSVGMVAKVMCGFFAVLGHVFPVFMKFKGGKGIATTIGVFAVCSPKVAIISGVIAIIWILLTEIGAMGSFIATTPPAFATCLWVYETYIQNQIVVSTEQVLLAATSNLFIISIIFLTWYAHRQNIKRLMAGEEHPTNWLQMVREKRILRKIKKLKENSIDEK